MRMSERWFFLINGKKQGNLTTYLPVEGYIKRIIMKESDK